MISFIGNEYISISIVTYGRKLSKCYNNKKTYSRKNVIVN